MDWDSFAFKEKDSLPPSQHQPFLPSHPQVSPSNQLQSSSFNGDSKISPSILLIIIILAIIFFISGLLHLLVRFLLRPSSRDPEDVENATAFQGQLQQLFHLHDSGVDQSFIDTLPVFLYKAIIGSKNPFDCAVCLCEFEADDKLRLLPKCSHAFHLECIDTWLLSHSTCPLCRGSLFPDFPPNNSCSPIVFVLESGSESSREIVADREATVGTNSFTGTGPHLGFHGEDQLDHSGGDAYVKTIDTTTKEDTNPVVSEEKIVPVKLGKFRNVDAVTGGGEGSSSSSNVDARRCFSMGSYEYVMDEDSLLQVPVRPPVRKQSSKKPSLPLTPGHRSAMSECDCNSRRDGFKGFEAMGSTEIAIHRDESINKSNEIGRSKRESFSISKIWLRSKDRSTTTGNSSRRAFSFRFPLHHAAPTSNSKSKQNGNSQRIVTEMDSARWDNGGSEFGLDEEVGSCNSLDSQANPPSFARRTLLWLVGRQNKVVHSSSSSTV